MEVKNSKSKKENAEYSDSTVVKKMKQGMSYTGKEKTIILNVFKYFKAEYSDLCVTEIVRRTAKATGCSEKSIFMFRKEEKTGFKEPSKTKVRKNININSRYIKYDDNVRQAIRTIIYDLKYKNVVPSLSTILKSINGDESLPNFSIMTLRRLLFDMGFYYEKDGRKSILVEKNGPKPPEMPVEEPYNPPAVENNQIPQNNAINIPQPLNYIEHQNRWGLPEHEHHHMGVMMPNHGIQPVHHLQPNMPLRPHNYHLMQPAGIYS
ncbi:unnamed protein product [Brassicogethes aeneus]|uniref:Uncharacterized protein n=1 Tax=Brassicogethes aeneus TaxID=1431903 RepID=A0A9P0FKW6_BRAAE|nr:unnamed protein product [Brassicogethes aeneus]